jgi:hypothetical protein
LSKIVEDKEAHRNTAENEVEFSNVEVGVDEWSFFIVFFMKGGNEGTKKEDSGESGEEVVIGDGGFWGLLVHKIVSISKDKVHTLKYTEKCFLCKFYPCIFFLNHMISMYYFFLLLFC